MTPSIPLYGPSVIRTGTPSASFPWFIDIAYGISTHISNRWTTWYLAGITCYGTRTTRFGNENPCITAGRQYVSKNFCKSA